LIVLQMILGIHQVYGQTMAQNYAFASQVGAYSPIFVSSGATHISSIPNGTDEAMESDVPIGFTFNYRGTDFTTLAISTNGYESLSSTPFQNYGNDLMLNDDAVQHITKWNF